MPETPSSKARTASSLSLANPGKRARPSGSTPCRPKRNPKPRKTPDGTTPGPRRRRPQAGNHRGVEHLEHTTILGPGPPPGILGKMHQMRHDATAWRGAPKPSYTNQLLAGCRGKPAWEEAPPNDDNSQATLQPPCLKRQGETWLMNPSC